MSTINLIASVSLTATEANIPTPGPGQALAWLRSDGSLWAKLSSGAIVQVVGAGGGGGPGGSGASPLPDLPPENAFPPSGIVLGARSQEGGPEWLTALYIHQRGQQAAGETPLVASTTRGEMLVANPFGGWSRLSPGTVGQVLTMGAQGAVAWADLPAGTGGGTGGGGTGVAEVLSGTWDASSNYPGYPPEKVGDGILTEAGTWAANDGDTDGAYVRQTFGTAATVSRVRLYPRPGSGNGLLLGGAVVEARTGAGAYVTLGTVPASPVSDAWTDITISGAASCTDARVRFVTPPNRPAVAEVQFIGS